jgi:hypothetical protein
MDETARTGGHRFRRRGGETSTSLTLRKTAMNYEADTIGGYRAPARAPSFFLPGALERQTDAQLDQAANEIETEQTRRAAVKVMWADINRARKSANDAGCVLTVDVDRA